MDVFDKSKPNVPSVLEQLGEENLHGKGPKRTRMGLQIQTSLLDGPPSSIQQLHLAKEKKKTGYIKSCWSLALVDNL